MAWTFYNASGEALVQHAESVATQAAMEAATSTTTFVSPARTQYHPGVAKARCSIDINGAIESPYYNIDSITDTGTGDRTVVFDVDFSTIVYQTADNRNAGGSAERRISWSTHAVGSIRLQINDSTPSAIDQATSQTFFGDQ
jgi:hypothetical protein